MLVEQESIKLKICWTSWAWDAGKGCQAARRQHFRSVSKNAPSCARSGSFWPPKSSALSQASCGLMLVVVSQCFQYLPVFRHRNGPMIPSDHNWCLGLATSHQPPASFRHLQGLSVCWCGAKRWMRPSPGKISLLIPPNTGGLWWHGAMREHLGATKHGAKPKFKSGANNWVQAVTIYSYNICL